MSESAWYFWTTFAAGGWLTAILAVFYEPMTPTLLLAHLGAQLIMALGLYILTEALS
jgi:hypothetical protein